MAGSADVGDVIPQLCDQLMAQSVAAWLSPVWPSHSAVAAADGHAEAPASHATAASAAPPALPAPGSGTGSVTVPIDSEARSIAGLTHAGWPGATHAMQAYIILLVMLHLNGDMLLVREPMSAFIII